MPEQNAVAIFVKLNYWEAYWSTASIMARVFRKVLYIWGVAATITTALLLYAWVHPAPNHAWFELLQNSEPLYWVFALPLFVMFVLPLLSARKVVSSERYQQGFRYVFSAAGIYVESSVGKTELQWKAIVRSVETKSAFLLFQAVNIAHTLPKRCFADATEVHAMRELLRTNTSDVKLADS